ncbi:MAG TPA: HD domain-containing phosphohydrolase [Capsulimonadaceae bacterium]|jgi:response regulator RpfG family c-di-GMP phosphodiesterase
MTPKILCVDDDSYILDAYKRGLRKQFEIHTALGGQAGLALLASDEQFAVVVSDQHMPGISGVEFLSKAREVAPDTVRMMLTGNADLSTAINALNEGAIFRFLVKPVTPENLAVILQHGVDQYNLITAEKELLEKTLRGSVRILIEILSTVNPELFGRAQALRMNMRQLADVLGVTENWSVELAAMLGQIGMVTLPPGVFQRIEKGMSLGASEQAVVDRTPEISHNLLANIPRLEPVAKIIKYQDKHYDGSGLPDDGVKGDAIPIASRMLKVLLDWLSIESRGVTKSGVYALMRTRQGWYDPRVLEAAARMFSSKEDGPPQAAVPVKLANLRVGDMLSTNMETLEGKLLIAKGHQITATLLEKIINYNAIAGIKEPVYIERPHVATTTGAHGLPRRAA